MRGSGRRGVTDLRTVSSALLGGSSTSRQGVTSLPLPLPFATESSVGLLTSEEPLLSLSLASADLDDDSWTGEYRSRSLSRKLPGGGGPYVGEPSRLSLGSVEVDERRDGRRGGPMERGSSRLGGDSERPGPEGRWRSGERSRRIRDGGGERLLGRWVGGERERSRPRSRSRSRSSDRRRDRGERGEVGRREGL